MLSPEKLFHCTGCMFLIFNFDIENIKLSANKEFKFIKEFFFSR